MQTIWRIFLSRGLRLIAALALVAVVTDLPLAGTSRALADPGRDLAVKVHDRENGDDATSEGFMILVDKKDRKRVRELTTYSKDNGDLIRQIIRFRSPADIEGTGFLSAETASGETEQFLYLPALRRTRRIVSSQKSQSFVNSDFTYEDMERRPVDNFTHALAGVEKVGNVDCDILESRPKDGVESEYSLVKSRVARDIYVPLLVDYFDKKGRHIKTYRVLRLENIQGIWTETEFVMEDLEKKHKTIMKIEKIEYNTGLSEDLFSQQNLENW